MQDQFGKFVIDASAPGALKEHRFGYDFDGKDCPADSEKAVARAVGTSNQTRYFVKSRTFGAYSGGLYNPNTPGADTASRRNGIDPYKFREVNDRAFRSYLAFLASKNEAHLRLAEREMAS